MTFPVNGILDSFTRSNTGPPPGPDWSTPVGGVAGGPGLKTIGNQCGTDNFIDFIGAAMWTNTHGPDCEVYATVAAKPNDTDFLILGARYTEVSVSNWTGYLLYWFRDDTNSAGHGGDWIEVDAPPGGIVVSITHVVMGVGDAIGMSVIGNALTVYHKPSGGSWTQVATGTDSSITGAGHLYLMVDDPTTRFDDFGGGTLGRTGNLSQTLGALSLSADGWLERIGDLAQTLGALTLGAHGEALTYQYPILINVQRITASGAGAIGVDVVDHAISQNVRADSLVVENGGTLEARSVYYDTITTLGSGQIVPLRSDRAVWDVANYAPRHASDIDGSMWVYHTNPARAGTYTVTNPTTDRAFDVNSTSLFEIASVLGTLLGDLGMT